MTTDGSTVVTSRPAEDGDQPTTKASTAGTSEPERRPSRRGQVHFCTRCGGAGHTRNNPRCPRLRGQE